MPSNIREYISNSLSFFVNAYVLLNQIHLRQEMNGLSDICCWAIASCDVRLLHVCGKICFYPHPAVCNTCSFKVAPIMWMDLEVKIDGK